MISQHEFRKMNKEEQIKLFEKLFNDGKTVPGMARLEIDYSDKQLRGIVSDLGFRYNNKSKQYEFIGSNNESNNSHEEITVDYENNNIISNLRSNNESNSLGNILSNNEGNNEIVTREEFHILKQEVEEIRKKIQGTNEQCEYTTGAIKVRKFKGEPVNRTFKLYEEVQEQFKEFCEKHKKDYKVQDLISQALYEYMDKYK